MHQTNFRKQGFRAFLLCLLAVTGLSAQTRVTLPAGSVILVRTDQPLESRSAQVGQTFETTVVDPISVNGFPIIPANSRIRGVVAYVQPANRQQSGVMQVNFDRLTLPNGTSSTIIGKLTSTDSTERRQIEARSDTRVVLVGERGGIGAMIAGAGSTSSSAGGILAALGNMLSEGLDVSVPAGTQLAVQLEQGVTLTGQGAANTADESTIYTAADKIRAAQQALARKAYYRATVNGVLNNATRRALFEFQIDNGITPTGNLDGRTAAALGVGSATGAGGGVLSARDASVLRRAAQALESRQRADIGVSAEGRLNATRAYTESELELLFAFSAFADNASLYEQVARPAATSDGAAIAGRALVTAARRVDAALQQARTTSQMQNLWQSIRQQLAQIDATYAR
jgi:peptidoglycan hydrolase-like protein with peptidoglycan-binding domain